MAVYKAEVNKEQEKQLLEISMVLFRKELIKSPTAYAVTKFALLNLIESLKRSNQISDKPPGA